MKLISLLVLALVVNFASYAQTYNTDSALNMLKKQKDSTLRALIHNDSVKTEKEFAEREKWEKLKSVSQYPYFKGNEMAGIIPVSDLSEVPDPKMEYKLLFELTGHNPDSLSKEVNFGLGEVTRILNLHIASGIPLKNITPVIVIHAAALKAFTNNQYYQEKYKFDNPNIKVINELKTIGAKFIACGQAITFIDLKREALLPEIKISLTAQTVLSSYQMKGYVWYNIQM